MNNEWKNGDNNDLSKALEFDDAELIPNKTFFRSNYGDTYGKIVYKIDNRLNDMSSVLMFSDEDNSADFHNAKNLAIIAKYLHS